jgi:hypothetical protein
MRPDIFSAISKLSPGTAFSVNNDGLDGWDLSEIKTNEIQPTKAEIDAKLIELVAEYDSLQYQRDRQYPSIGDQLDMQYWDQVNGTTTWKDAVAKVKSDNPKP